MVQEFVIDGGRMVTLEDFFDEIGRVLIPGKDWGRHLDAFDDILCGWLDTPAEGFTIRWQDSANARKMLGYPETVRQLEIRLSRCHPTNRKNVRRDLENARAQRGPVVFDWLIEIIRDHGEGGRSAEDKVHLVLD